MHKNKLILLSLISFLSLTAGAQVASPTSAPSATAKATKKKIKIDYENELVTGSYDVPDAQFLNSRKLIKYKELFNKRTNFIEEIDSNKGVFNEYQK